MAILIRGHTNMDGKLNLQWRKRESKLPIWLALLLARLCLLQVQLNRTIWVSKVLQDSTRLRRNTLLQPKRFPLLAKCCHAIDAGIIEKFVCNLQEHKCVLDSCRHLELEVRIATRIALTERIFANASELRWQLLTTHATLTPNRVLMWRTCQLTTTVSLIFNSWKMLYGDAVSTALCQQ